MAAVLSGEIKIGNIIAYNNGKYRILKRTHVKPGKGGAFYQMEMKEITLGTKLNERIRSEDKLEKLETSVREFQFLYTNDDRVAIMDKETYEQLDLNIEMFNGYDGFLTEDLLLEAEYVDDELVNIKMPINLVGEVSETEVNIKGGTVTSSYKPAILTNGFKTSVPPYIENGQRITISSETGEFVKKAD